jgi:tetratricopeptide (TPR) repeat protein
MGQALFALKDYDAAEKAFTQAVEEDIVPMRILQPMQRIVAEVAASEQVPLVDFPAIIRAAYARQYDHTIFGKEYFPDHVHTNIEGYRLLGLALFDRLVEQGIATPDAAWNDARIEAVGQAVIANLDPAIEGRTYVNLGKVLDWAGKHEEAYRMFKAALEILGPNPMLYDRLARSAYLCGKVDESIQYLRETLARYPRMPEINSRLATLLQNQGKNDEAIEHCFAELDISPKDYDVHARLASLLEQKGDDAGALSHYNMTLLIKPDHEYAQVKLAYLLIRQKRYDEALPHAREALRINPRQYRAHTAIGIIMTHQGDAEQAAHHFSQALQLNPEDMIAKENLQQLQSGPDVSGVAGSLSRYTAGGG